MTDSRWELKGRGIVVLALVALLACLGGLLLVSLVAPGPTPLSDAVVYVKPGESLSSVARKLANAKVIRSSFFFRLRAALSGRDHSVKPGVYRFGRPLAPSDVLDKLETGGEEKALTIPEGLTVAQVAELLARAGFGNKEDFLSLATDRRFLSEAGVPAQTVEGYLFPDTYQISRVMEPKEIFLLMVRRFQQVIDSTMRERAAELGLSIHQVLTLASLIEKETAQPTERPVISAVFHNRLRRGMPLQCDPTVIYALGKRDGRLTRQDLAAPSAYNTYVHKGLPPGPIANPGLAAIKAALHPAASDALYFVSRNDGTHQFSSTLPDHNRAVARYQRKHR